MKFRPLVSLWVLLPYLTLALAAAGWQIWQVYRKPRAILLRWTRRAALLILPAIIAFGPSVQGGTSAPGVANLDVIFAVDTTPSMGAIDYAGSQQRIDGVKKDLLALGARLQGARLELITFDTNANVILPFTTDETAFASAVQGMTPEISDYSQGSEIDKPISLVQQELQDSKATSPEHGRLFFYLGDGEQTANAPVQSFAPIAPYLNGGAVMGYGTTGGAKIINNNSPYSTSNQASYIMTVDPSTQTLVPAISHMDPTALQQIASQLRVPFTNRDQGGSVSNLYQNSNIARSIDRSEHIVRYLNLYWLLSIPFVVLLFLEWEILLTNLLSLRESKGGRRA